MANHGAFRLFFSLACLLLVSCSDREEAALKGAIRGDWTNADRTLSFALDGRVTVLYKNNPGIKALRGPYSLDGSTVSFSVAEYTSDGQLWLSVENTELGGHTEKMKVTIDGNELTTVIELTGTEFRYTKVSPP